MQSTTVGGVGVNYATSTRWGGTIGVGLEYGFAPNWTAAVEYDHLYMGNRTLNFIGIATPTTSRTDAIKQDADIASVRVNYRWGGPVIAKY